MKFGKTLVDFAMEIQNQMNAKKDYIVDTRRMHFDTDKNGAQLSLFNDATNTTTILGVNEIAHDQIGTKLGIPGAYYDRMRTENPELLATNVNSWFETKPNTYMVRTLYGNARALLSDKYYPIDNFEIAQTVLPIIAEMPEATIESCEVTDRRMYIKVVNPRLTSEVVPGDIVQSGIMISNSEVGYGNMMIQPLVYRLVCKNGMVVNDAATKKRHVGRKNVATEDYSLYTDETKHLDDLALMAKVRDTVRAIVDQTRFDKVVDLMRQAKGAKIETTNIPAMIELTGKQFGFNQQEGTGILDFLIRGGDLTLYGVSNAVTRFAQDVDSYDRSTELESVGYDILGMSPVMWNRLNAVSTLNV